MSTGSDHTFVDAGALGQRKLLQQTTTQVTNEVRKLGRPSVNSNSGESSARYKHIKLFALLIFVAWVRGYDVPYD